MSLTKGAYELRETTFVLGLGIVKKCTLTGSVRTVSYGNTSYCMVNKGKKGQNEAIDECKKLNAQLPLPKSKNEADKLREVTGTDDVWIGIRDLTKSGDESKWKDAEENFIGNRYVNLRVII